MDRTDKIYYSVIRQLYCYDNKHNCARYIVGDALGEEKIPDDLLPEELAKAYKIINK
ncbi:hypothetical protein KQI42_00145 [Tissierella sp. MSJ-40]|uniref:Uncharacterized protein n=1 Tax=Tissierella simiarum TaxID=2841534 RepID=A0ABS6E0G9_9FIRM|nr:hypothetical protein [Tissierella simiarum]MBU5436398.1 hypothetical protein [Tissierella simiarum]